MRTDGLTLLAIVTEMGRVQDMNTILDNKASRGLVHRPREEGVHRKGEPFKEAAPFTVELVKAMEIWWVLCMIFASLRFDDAVHVKPLELEVTQDGIFRVSSWQTKTERKRRGTKF